MHETLTKFIHLEPVMGTVVTFDVRGERPAGEAIEAAVAWLHEVDAEFSTYRPDSAVCRFDRGKLVPSAASDHLRWVIDCCERLRRETGGYFDAYANGPFDPSALVEGWARQARVQGGGWLRGGAPTCRCSSSRPPLSGAGR